MNEWMQYDDIEYLCHTICNMAGVPIRIYKNQEQLYYYSRISLPKDPIILVLDMILSIKKNVGYYISEDFYYYGFVNYNDYTLILGPSRHTPMTDQELKKLAFELDIEQENFDTFLIGMKSIIAMPLESILQIMCTMNFVFNHEKMTPEAVSIFDKDQLSLYHQISDEEFQAGKYIALSEPSVEDLRNNFKMEQDIADMVRRGDTKSFHEWVRNAPVAKPAHSTTDSIRHQKNVIITSATIVSRAAIRGGMAIDDAIRLSDSYLQKSEKSNNYEQLTNLQYHMVENFIREVELLKYSGNHSNLVKGVTNYVRHHISDAIKTEDIANSLFVSRSYLSTRFKHETGQTLCSYIRTMKISEAKHLLTHSDKSLLTISIYLGFSSQSHFCRVFKTETGMSPVDYKTLNQFKKTQLSSLI